MRCALTLLFPLGAVVICHAPVAAQASRSKTTTDRARRYAMVAVDSRLYPQPARPVFPHRPSPLPVLSDGSSERLPRGLIAGAIGAVAGVATCTLLSNAFFNEGGGFSTCTTKGNLLFAGGGFALGFAIGWLTG